MEKAKCTKKDPITTLETKRSNLEGEVTCFHCSKVQTYEELLKDGDCMQCGTNLIGELF